MAHCTPSLEKIATIADDTIWECDSTGILIDGNYAYVMSYYFGGSRINGMAVVDISDVYNPAVVATFTNSDHSAMNQPNECVKDGDYLYIASHGNDGLLILDVSDPTAPSFVGEANGLSTADPSSPDTLVKDGNYVYTGGSFHGIVTFDVSNPAAPAVVGANGTSGHDLYDMVKVGDYLLATHQGTGAGVRVFDVSDPLNPSVVTTFTHPSLTTPQEITLNGDGSIAYVVCNSSDALLSLDVSDPTSPTLLGVVINGIELNRPYGLHLHQDILYITGNNYLTAWDVSDPTSMLLLDSLDDLVDFSITCGAGVARSGDHLFVNGWMFTVVKTNCLSAYELPPFDLVDGECLKYAGAIPFTVSSSPARMCSYLDRYVLVADQGDNALLIVDLLDPTNPVLTASLVDVIRLDQASDVKIMLGRYAVVVASDYGIVVVDLYDISNPVIVGEYADATIPWTLVVDGSYVHYTSVSAGNYVKTLDLSDPTTPVLVDTISAADLLFTGDIAQNGRYGVVVTNAEKVLSVYFNQPWNPTILDTIDVSPSLDGPDGVDVRGSYAYISCYNSDNIAVLDKSNPTDVYVAALFNASGAMGSLGDIIAPQGTDYVFVTDQQNHLVWVVDVSDILNIEVVDHVDGGLFMNNPWRIVMVGTLVVVSCGNHLVILDATGCFDESPTPSSIGADWAIGLDMTLPLAGSGVVSMEILDTLDFTGWPDTAAQIPSNLAWSPAAPNMIWGLLRSFGVPSDWLPTAPYPDTGLIGIDISDPSNLSVDKIIPAGQDLTLPTTYKYVNPYRSVLVDPFDQTQIIASGGGSGVVRYDILTDVTEQKGYYHPNELTMRTQGAAFWGQGNGYRMFITAPNMDTFTIYNTTPGALARIQSFTTWSDVAATYGVSLVTTDTSGPNYTNGINDVVGTQWNNRMLVVNTLSKTLMYINTFPETSPSIYGTPLDLSPWMDRPQWLVRLNGKYTLVIGGDGAGNGIPYVSDGQTIILVVDTSHSTNLSVVGVFTDDELWGSGRPGAIPSGYVICPSTSPSSGIMKIDFRDPYNPQKVEFLADERVAQIPEGYSSYLYQYETLILGNHAYIRSWTADSWVIDDYTYNEDVGRIISVRLS